MLETLRQKAQLQLRGEILKGWVLEGVVFVGLEGVLGSSIDSRVFAGFCWEGDGFCRVVLGLSLFFLGF